jgi:Flp pilus assembly protein TadD
MNIRALMVCFVVLVSLCGCAEKRYTHAQEVQYANLAVQTTLYMRIPDAEAAIKQNPDNVLAHERLAEDLFGHDSPRAMSELRKVLQLEPGNRQAQYELAYELRRAGNVPEAKTIYEQLAMQDDAWGQGAKRHLQQL